MKAYYVSIRNDEDQGGGITFANTAQEARGHYYSFDLDPERWIDVQAHRAKEYDGMENLPPAQLALKQWKNGWRWFFVEYPDPDEATDEEFIAWHESVFPSKKSP